MYQNPAITAVLRSAYFGSFTAMGHKYKDYYISSHPDELEPELPIPLVALVATGVSFVSCYEFCLLPTFRRFMRHELAWNTSRFQLVQNFPIRSHHALRTTRKSYLWISVHPLFIFMYLL